MIGCKPQNGECRNQRLLMTQRENWHQEKQPVESKYPTVSFVRLSNNSIPSPHLEVLAGHGTPSFSIFDTSKPFSQAIVSRLAATIPKKQQKYLAMRRIIQPPPRNNFRALWRPTRHPPNYKIDLRDKKGKDSKLHGDSIDGMEEYVCLASKRRQQRQKWPQRG